MEMLDILNDLDLLLSSHSSFLFGKWIQDASKFGINAEEIAYYRKNARCLLTTWGEKGSSLRSTPIALGQVNQWLLSSTMGRIIRDVYRATRTGQRIRPKSFQ